MLRDMVALVIYLVLFGTIGLLGVISYFNNVAIINVGLAPKLIDGFLVFLSILGILKTVFHIHKF